VKGRSIPLSVLEQAELDVFIKEHVETGHIRSSKSPWTSPFFFVKKKDDETTTHSGLSEVELSYHQEPISPSLDLGDHAHIL
jgi:hypothetical protein